MACDRCDTSHQRGDDRCPACQDTPDAPPPPATPIALLRSLEEAMRQCQMSGGHVDTIELVAWIALVNTLRRRLEEANSKEETG